LIVTHHVGGETIARLSTKPFAIGCAWGATVFAAYLLGDLHFVRLPFLPVATVGTAVAFLLGMRANAAYDRFWEARKIWGGIVNTSRTWGNLALTVLPNHRSIAEVLIRRHIAWLSALRTRLRRPSPWTLIPEDVAAFHQPAKDRFGADYADDYLSAEDQAAYHKATNGATALLRMQGAQLSKILEEEKLSIFHQIELLRQIQELYTLQGKCERIKNTPFPVQYTSLARLMNLVFLTLAPFGLIETFTNLTGSIGPFGETGVEWAAATICYAMIVVVYHWLYLIAERTENPFEFLAGDVPMNALCRTIEIDLLEMLDETDIPEPVKPMHAILY